MLPARKLKEIMDRKNYSKACCLIFLVSSLLPQLAQAQGGMGMGGMGNMGGLRNTPSMGGGSPNDPPPEPEKPVVKFNPFSSDAPPVDGLESRTTALERFVFGHAETKPKMKVRVQRLEKKLVPYEHHAASEMDLDKRVNHLWSTLEAGNRGSTRAPGSSDAGSKDSGEKEASSKNSGSKKPPTEAK
jgi:hypothetical protein